MNKPFSFNRVGFELLQAQLIWSFWYLGILLVVDLVRLFIFNTEIDLLYNQSYVASNVFMLVIGIIAIYFLPYYVENGVTRKNYFLGNILAAVSLSILIPIISYVITLLQSTVLTSLNESQLASVPDTDTNLIGDMLQSILLTPYVDIDTNVLMSLFIFSLNIFVFYLIGWLIGTAFYRLGVIGGLLFIVIAILFIAVKDSMLRIALSLPLFESFSMFDIASPSMASLLVFIVIGITLFLIYLLTRRAPIKI